MSGFMERTKDLALSEGFEPDEEVAQWAARAFCVMAIIGDSLDGDPFLDSKVTDALSTVLAKAPIPVVALGTMHTMAAAKAANEEQSE